VPGELFIGGDGLARGYRNRPDLTAERFVTCPPELGGGRMYRTGDRCRWRGDGEIEFLGRLDHQIKLRGFRIEPGEIEAALRQCPGVREAVVQPWEESPGDLRLAAYVVAQPAPADAAGLRAALEKQLPDYMVPSVFVFLTALPLTPNGKLDRKALPKPEVRTAEAGPEVPVPETLLEQRLVEQWEACLGVRGLTPEDDFFNCGGHSLLAARLIQDISRITGQPVPLAALFHAPTPRKLARLLAGQGQLPPWTALVPLKPEGGRPPVFFVHGLGGSVGVFLGLARRLPPDQPAYGLQALGSDGRIIYRDTVEAMAAHYVEEMVSFQPSGSYHVAGYSMGGVIAYEIARQLQQAGRPVGMVALFDTQPILCRMPWHVFVRAIVPHWMERGWRHWRSGTWLATNRELARYLAGRWRAHWRVWRGLSGPERRAYLRGRYAALRYWLLTREAPQADPPDPGPAPSPAADEDPLQFAGPEYRLRPYPGAVDFFLCADPSRTCLPIWRHMARGGVRVHQILGKHSRVFDPANLDELASRFAAALQPARPGKDLAQGTLAGPAGR